MVEKENCAKVSVNAGTNLSKAKNCEKCVLRRFALYRFEHRYVQFMVDLPVDRISRALPH